MASERIPPFHLPDGQFQNVVWPMVGPDSSHALQDPQRWKVQREENTDAPFHTENFCSGDATALIFMMAGANDVNCNCHALTDSLEHGRGILQNGIRGQALEDVEVAYAGPISISSSLVAFSFFIALSCSTVSASSSETFLQKLVHVNVVLVFLFLISFLFIRVFSSRDSRVPSDLAL